MAPSDNKSEPSTRDEGPRVNWELGPFYELDLRGFDGRAFRFAVTVNRQDGGSVDFSVDGSMLRHADLTGVGGIDLGNRLLGLLEPHVGALVETRWLPRSDNMVIGIRVADEATAMALRRPVSDRQTHSTSRGISQSTSHGRTYSTSGSRGAVVTALSIEGIYGFGESQTLPLDSTCTIAFGENGSGKSSVRKIFGALRRLSRAEIIFPSHEEWVFVASTDAHAATSKSSLSVEVRVGTSEFAYEVGFVRARTGGFAIQTENLTVAAAEVDRKYPIRRPSGGFDCEFSQTLGLGSQPGHYAEITGPATPERAVLSLLSDGHFYPAAAAVGNALQGLRLYSSWDFVSGSTLAGRKSMVAEYALAEDGSNLVSVLTGFQSTPAKRDFDDWFDRVMDGGPSLRADSGVIVYEHEGRHLNVADLSDGSLRWAQVVAATMSPASLLVLDEPELGLHPDLIDSLAELLAATSLRTRLLVFTHSKDLLDRLDEQGGSSFVAFEQNRDGNEITIPDIDGLRAGEETCDVPLGQLWAAGYLGGNRW